MNELLVVPPKDQFDRQAAVHRQIRDSLHEVVSTFDVHYDTILSQLDSSQPGQVERYQQWWQKFKTPWGTKFHDEKQNGDFGATDDIYVDADGNYWIGPHGSDYVTAFP